MVSRITHGQHSLRQMFELIRKQKILQKYFLNRTRSGEDIFDSCSKKAVTQPAGTFPGRAVHKHIQCVLSERPDCRIANQAKGLIVGNPDLHSRFRVLIFDDTDI